MAEPIPLVELELRIAQLPPISCGACGPLGGPTLHARRLIELWKLEDDLGIELAQSFRLLDRDAVEGALLRTLLMGDREYPSDPRHWIFPSLEELLFEMREAVWEEMQTGTLLTEAKEGLRAKRYRTVLPSELARLTPDWELSRLTHAGVDEFFDVRIRHQPLELVKKTWRWREHPSQDAFKAAVEDMARTCSQGAKPSEPEILKGLKARLGPGVTRQMARDAVRDFAPHLRGRRGYRSKS